MNYWKILRFFPFINSWYLSFSSIRSGIIISLTWRRGIRTSRTMTPLYFVFRFQLLTEPLLSLIATFNNDCWHVATPILNTVIRLTQRCCMINRNDFFWTVHLFHNIFSHLQNLSLWGSPSGTIFWFLSVTVVYVITCFDISPKDYQIFELQNVQLTHCDCKTKTWLKRLSAWMQKLRLSNAVTDSNFESFLFLFFNFEPSELNVTSKEVKTHSKFRFNFCHS